MPSGPIPQGEMQDVNTGILEQQAAHVRGDELARAIIRHLRMTPLPPPPGDHGRKFLGIDAGSWLKMILAGAGAVIVFLATWFQAVNSGIEARPTKDEVGRAIQVHAETPGQHKTIEQEQRTIRESQIRTEVLINNQAETLKNLNDTLRTINITRRRDAR